MTVQFEGRRKRGQIIRVWERLDEVGGLWVSPYIPEWCHFGSRQGVAPTEPPAVWMTKCWSGCSEGPQRGLRKSTGDTVNTSHSIPPANHYKRHCALQKMRSCCFGAGAQSIPHVSTCAEPVWFSYLWGIQKKIFWGMSQCFCKWKSMGTKTVW